MDLWGYNVDTTLEWVAFVLILALTLALYFSLVWFVEKFSTGMVGGFILMVTGMGLVIIPSLYLISTEARLAQIFTNSAAIIAGCITVLFGAFSLRNYQDF